MGLIGANPRKGPAFLNFLKRRAAVTTLPESVTAAWRPRCVPSHRLTTRGSPGAHGNRTLGSCRSARLAVEGPTYPSSTRRSRQALSEHLLETGAAKPAEVKKVQKQKEGRSRPRGAA